MAITQIYGNEDRLWVFADEYDGLMRRLNEPAESIPALVRLLERGQ